jgi:hypothetical protein
VSEAILAGRYARSEHTRRFQGVRTCGLDRSPPRKFPRSAACPLRADSTRRCLQAPCAPPPSQEAEPPLGNGCVEFPQPRSGSHASSVGAFRTPAAPAPADRVVMQAASATKERHRPLLPEYCQLKSGETLRRPYAELLDRADRARRLWNGSFFHATKPTTSALQRFRLPLGALPTQHGCGSAAVCPNPLQPLLVE